MEGRIDLTEDVSHNIIMVEEEQVSNLGKPSTSTKSEEDETTASKATEVFIAELCVVVPISEKEEEDMGRRIEEPAVNPSWFTPKRYIFL